jgi:hypothetical protein
MAIAKFNGKSCPMCGAELIAGQSEIEPHPTQRGPKGGKVWVCAHHVHGASENPFTNAGRRTKRGKAAVYAKGAMKGKPRKPRMTAAAVPEGYYMGMSLGSRDKATGKFTGPLARLAASGDAGARAEIARRERSVEKGGVKMSWTVEKPKKPKKTEKAAANPFSGYGFYY